MKQYTRVLWMIFVTVFCLCLFGSGFASEETDTAEYRDDNFTDGIFFQVTYPERDSWFSAGNSVEPFDVHRWKTVTISAKYRYKDVNGKTHEVGGDGEFSTNDPGILLLQNEIAYNLEGGVSLKQVKVFTKNEGAGTITYACVAPPDSPQKGKTVSGSLTINVRKLTVGGDSEVLRYAALSILAYENLDSFQGNGKTIEELATPQQLNGPGAIYKKPVAILNENFDRYNVFADLRDLVIASAGSCKVEKTKSKGSFYGVLFNCGNQNIMAFRGTNGLVDLLEADISLGLGLFEINQFRSALDFYKENNVSILTGHSLGGGLANYVSILTGTRAVTFNAPSTVVTAVSNFLVHAEDGLLGRNYIGLDDQKRTDYVNNSDWVGKVGIGDAPGNIFTDSSVNLTSGRLDRTVFQTPMTMNNSGLHIWKVWNDHDVLRMISYNRNGETVSMSPSVGSTSPKHHNFKFIDINYFFGSAAEDTISSAIEYPLDGIIFAGAGDDTIRLSGYYTEIIIGGAGNDTIYSSESSVKSIYYYYPDHGHDIIHDFDGNDELHIYGYNSIKIYKDDEADHYYITGNGSSDHILDLYIGTGRGSFSVFLEDELINDPLNPIKRSSVFRNVTNIKCPVKIDIYNEFNHLVETVEDGMVYNGRGEYGSFVTYETDNGYGKTITLTSDGYRLVITGTGEGFMEYTSSYITDDQEKTKAISRVPVHVGSLYYPAAMSDDILLSGDLDGDGIIDFSPLENEINNLALNQSELTLVLGSTSQLIPIYSPSDAEADLLWSSSDPDIAEVAEDGIVTALGVGEATITITALNGENITADCTISVPDENLSISEAEVTGFEEKILYTGEAYYPTITVSFRGLTLTEGKAYRVEYSDEIMPGTAYITIHGMGPFQGTKIVEYEIYQDIPQTVSEAVTAIVQEMNENGITGQYDQAVWLHDWLVYHANYDYTYTYYDADGVLLYGTGVCQSYALAYQLLLNEIGIENRVVFAPEMEHAWNLVYLENEWCHIDCTWDDPGTGGGENHFYFGMNDDLIARDHTWDRSSYTVSTSLQNYYPIRNGELVFADENDLDAVLEPFFTAQEDSVTVMYIGTDPSVTALDAFEDWYSKNNWKYGIRGFATTYSKYICTIRDIVYTEPWQEPVNKLSDPVDAPSFSMNSPIGNFSLESYRGNGVVLIFGRNGCLNTRGLLQRLQAELEALHNNGIEVLISIESAETFGDIQEVKKDYPSFNYCYEQHYLLNAYLEAVDYYNTYDTGYVTYPCVFIINGDGKITYYSTGYVSNMDELVSEAFATSSLTPLPVPVENQYTGAETGNANLSDLSDGNVKRALQEACAESTGVFFLTDSSLYYYDSLMMDKWEAGYSLLDSLGLSFVACFEELSEEDRQAYPHITFVEYDEEDNFFWDLLGAVNWDFSVPAYYQCSYFLEHDGHIADYSNGGTLSVWGKAVVLVKDMTYDMVLPAQLETVDDGAFYGGTFASVDLGASDVVSIGNMAFADCRNLSLIRLPDTLSDIDPNAFLNSDNVVFVCSGGSAAAEFADANDIPLICP